MEGRGGKIFEYLRENGNLDLEVPDIAFNVKKSEKTVEAALVKLQLKGLVTARQNEFGSVYWYALSSAPATKTVKLVDGVSPKENSVNTNDSMDDEVDLSELTAKVPPPAPAKKKGKKHEVPPADLFDDIVPPQRNTAKISVVPASPSPRQAASQTTAPAQKANVIAPVKPPPPPPTASLEDMAEFEAKESSFPTGRSISTGTEPPVATERSDVFNLRVTAAIAIGAAAMLLAIVAYFGGMGISSKVLTLKADIAKKYVTIEEFSTVKAETAKTAQLEAKIAQLVAQVASLEQKLQAPPPPEPVKKPVAKRTYRRR